MSAFTPVDTEKEFPREEIEEAFAHYWSLGGAGERWSEFADLYTEDAILIDRVIEDVKTGREEIREYLDRVMNRTMPALYTICLLYTSPSPRDGLLSRMPSSA